MRDVSSWKGTWNLGSSLKGKKKRILCFTDYNVKKTTIFSTYQLQHVHNYHLFTATSESPY